jgi:hypothetical protein
MKLSQSLAANLLFIFSFTTALATDFNLPNDQWRLISLPANPPTTENTVKKVFADDIPGRYGANAQWVVYEYDTGANQYRELTLSAPLVYGKGYWIIQITGQPATLDMPEKSNNASNIATNLVSSTNDKVQWNLVGYPLSSPGSLDDLAIKAANSDICGAAECSFDASSKKKLTHNKVWTYDGNAYVEKGAGSSLSSWEGFWVASLPGSNGYDLSLVAASSDSTISTVSTFHSGSLYWSPISGSRSKKVFVEYKLATSDQWLTGLPMKYAPIAAAGINPVTKKRFDKADYRGSIVSLQPDKTYDVRLTLEGTHELATARLSTWSENFPIGKTIKVANQNKQLTISESGTENGYLLIDGSGSTIDVQNNDKYNILLDGVEYVIIRGFTLKGAKKSAIRFKDDTTNRHIVIENNDISGWGEKSDGYPFGANLQAAVYGGWHSAVVSTVIQRNKIHDPRWGSNSWAENHGKSTNHPAGPQAISIGVAHEGNLIVRYNTIWSNQGHYYNDVLGLGRNSSYEGFPGPDSDIYGNYIANCFDDAIEAEGSDTNVRIWNNYITEAYLGIGNAAVSIGPLYIWNNVFARAYSPVGSEHGTYGPVIKNGHASKEEFMTGHTYFFHNTVLQPNGEGFGGIGVIESNGRITKHFTSRNNILQVHDVATNSITVRNGNSDIDYDYDLMNRAYPDGHEKHGISGVPIYANASPLLDINSMAGDFRLSPSSPGYAAGAIIPNFSDNYPGTAPDIGAQQQNRTNMTYGVNASQ